MTAERKQFAKGDPIAERDILREAVKGLEAGLELAAAERDRLAKEVERLREVNTALVKQARALLPANIDKDPDAFSDDWHDLAYEVRKAERLAKEQS